MKKAMFHKFTNFLQQAVDSLSTNVAPQEEFIYHWKSVTSYFVDNKDGNVRIEETALPEHLSSMLRIIQEEESDLGDAGTTGACLEYVLQHRLLETLYTLGRTDHPPGMKQIVLCFFTKLLSRISHPLLPHINVHRAVQRLVKACGETKAAPTEKEEIEFLCTVCAKIKTDPYLVNFFIESKSAIDKGMPRTPARPIQPFSLVDALLALSHSEDARVSVKACEGLMLCASLPEQSAASALIHHTQFCQSITEKVCHLYDKLPTMVRPEDIEAVEAKWGFDIIIERNEQQSFDGKGQVISFLSWLDYCDQLISVANPEVGTALAASMHCQLFTGHMLPQLLQPCESGAIVATTYLTRCLRTICSQAFLKEMSVFLLGSERNPEQKDVSGHPVNKRLLERCNHLSEEVCISTLKLFDTLLQKEEEHIYYCLLLRNLLGRAYLLDSTPSTPPVLHKEKKPDELSVDNSGKDSDECANTASAEKKPVLNKENSTEKKEFLLSENASSESVAKVNISDNTGLLTSPDSLPHEISQESSDTENQKDVVTTANNVCYQESPLQETASLSKTHSSDLKEVEKVVSTTSDASSSSKKSPSESESSPSSPSMSSSLSSIPGISSPKFGRSEVHKVVNCFLSLLPEEAKSSYQTADSSYDMYLRDAHRQFSIQETVSKSWGWPKKPVSLPGYEMENFYEGSFLHMLLDKLLHLLDQSYSVNLLLTSLISKVALIPHPNLHEFLLDPFVPTPEGTRTLYSVLIKVTNEIKHHQKSDPAFQQKLLMARKQLLGLVPTIHRFEGQGCMEAIIVLEEFCKELSAITFVKHHAAVTRF